MRPKNRSVKAQMKYANKIGAKYTMVLGESELESGIAKLKEMETGTEREVDFRADLAQALYDITIERATEDLAEEFGGEALASAMGMKR